MVKNKPVRESGIELLRIIMMLQVIFLHVCDFGKFTAVARSMPENHYVTIFYWCSFLLSRCPVYVFIVITGYFCINAKNYYTNKTMKGRVLKTWIPMLFYAVILTAVVALSGLIDVPASVWIKSFLPLSGGMWYFMSLYLILLLFIPFINMAIANLDKKQFQILLGIMFLLFCVWQPLTKLVFFKSVFKIDHTFNTEQGKSLYDFIFMYILGGYIRRFTEQREKPRWIYAALFFALGFINVACVHVFSFLEYSKIVAYNDNIFAVAQTVCLIMFFKDLRFKSRAVNKFASFNLGIFMIHMHPMFRQVIWDNIFDVTKTKAFYSTWYFPFKIMLICLAIYFSCCAIDELRQLLFSAVETLMNKRKLKKAS